MEEFTNYLVEYATLLMDRLFYTAMQQLKIQYIAESDRIIQSIHTEKYWNKNIFPMFTLAVTE